MRCDLHVHTNGSGQCTVPGLSRYCPEPRNEPLALYRTAGASGITEHDQIELQRRSAADFESFCGFSGIEAVNGHILSVGNRRVADFAVRHRKPVTGRSDSHTLNGLRRTFAVVQGARNAYDYVAALRRGHGVPYGESGSCWKLMMRTISGIGWSMVRANRRTAVLSPLFAFVPLFAAVNFLREQSFAWYWGWKSRRLEPEGKLLSLEVAAL